MRAFYPIDPRYIQRKVSVLSLKRPGAHHESIDHHPHFDWRRARSEAASAFKVMADVLKLVREEQGKATASYHYVNEARLINGVLSGQFSALDRECLPESDDQLQAVVHLFQTLAPGHYRRLH